MPDPNRTQDPSKTETPAESPERYRRADPERLCPNQKTTITRTVFPFLPE